MSRTEQNENTSPVLIAGLACLLCLPVLYLATRPVVWLFSAPGTAWMMAAIFAVAPLTVAFMVLYRCAWHDDRPRARRFLSIIACSCIIYGVDLLLAAAVVMIGCLIAGLSRVMGGN
ncbi:MAG TPA: hypothetical protein VGV18_12590 [Verrucomicrobiae bacterium]|nr:hypothetical protein [Verrucomicrobiae bacterium]